MKRITISTENVLLTAVLNETETAEKMWGILPMEGNGNSWGEEIYFSIPLHLMEEPSAHADVEIGDLGYWPPGKAFCIFFGPTPASSGEKPRAASPVNVFGVIQGDATQLSKVKDGSLIRIFRAV